MSEAASLLALQDADLRVLRLNKQFEELPQRQKAVDTRAKRDQVRARATQVAELRKECDKTLALLNDEAASIKQKIAESQGKMDTAKNYKETEQFSREIEGLARRLEKVEYDTLQAMERSDKIAAVETQVNDAQAKLKAQEDALIASFREDGTSLKGQIAQAEAERKELAAALSPDTLQRYEKRAQTKGGIGAAQLEGGRCSACRVAFSDGQMNKLQNGPEIGECPFCHRLLVVVGE
jgi:predicted  nucleic acid-binding Zn-ribbon protein